jgi:NAD+ synthase
MHTRAKDISAWLERKVYGAGAGGLVVGLSGGLDSAVVARLCQLAVPDRVLAVVMPCHSDSQDEADARLVAQHFGLPVIRVDLDPVYDRLAADLQAGIAAAGVARGPAGDDDPRKRAAANLKPRLRMTSLYFVANSLNYLVAGTSNKCELTIGYFTKYGDGGADVLPLGNLLKSDVKAFARDLGIPQPIIDKAPSAGLWAGQTDEAEMGFSYADLERYLSDGPDAVAPALALRIDRLERATEHKRSGPMIPEAE